jgi:hypothetical protein
MAEDKKPKIDLKNRLKKMGAGAPAGLESSPVAVPVPGRSGAGLTPVPPPGLPPPPGIPRPGGSVPAPAIDPSNPLAAVAIPFQTRPPPPAPSQPHKIEIDEHTVQAAKSSARRPMFLLAGIAAAGGAALGYFIGTGTAKSANANAAKDDAHAIAKDLAAAQDQLNQVATKVKAGLDGLTAKAPKFPDGLDKDLSAITIDFDGSKLASRRFSSLPSDVAHDLVDVVTSVQALNDKKRILVGNLSLRQKPVNDWIGFMVKAPDGSMNPNPPFTWAIVVDRDAVNNGALLVPFAAPLSVPTDKPLPEKFTLVKGKANADIGRYTGAELKDPTALALSPGVQGALCTSQADQKTIMQQLINDMNSVVSDIRKEATDSTTLSGTETKAGILDKCCTGNNNLLDRLNHI